MDLENKIERKSAVEINLTDSTDFIYMFQISLLEEALSETLLPSDMISVKKITEEEGSDSTKCLDAYELNSAGPQYKKLVDEITKYVIEDLYTNTVPEDLSCSYEVLSAKNRMVFLCFCIWIVGVMTIFFFTSDAPYCGPLPT